MKILILFLIGIVFSVLTLMKCYVYFRFLRHSKLINKWLGLTFLVLLGIGEIALFVVRDAHFATWQYLLVGACVVLDYALFVACVCTDIARMCFKYFKKRTSKTSQTKAAQSYEQDSIESAHFPHKARDTENISLQSNNASFCASPRRAFLTYARDGLMLILFAFFSLKGFINALSVPPVKEVRIKIPNLARKQSIVLMSDIHVGKTLGKDFLAKVVDKVNALNADMVVIVGDLVDDKIHLVKDDLSPLKALKSAEGTYYVAGNHEYYHGIDSILAYLPTLGLEILHNTSKELSAINLAGVSDLAGEQFGVHIPDIESAKKSLNPHKPSVLLAHQPKFVVRNDVSDFDVVLCGHTHAGQVFPLSFFVWLDQHYIHGLYTLENRKKTQLYVSSGVGFWGPAIRFLAPSEIVHIILE